MVTARPGGQGRASCTTTAVLHRGRLNRDELVAPAVGEDEAAGMLREMAGRADQLAGEVHGKPHWARTPASDQPQTCEDSILMRSSGRPSALPTSRSAPFSAGTDA